MPFVIGIGGATCSGKTTLCSKLIELWKSRLKIHIINQDDYFLPKEQVERIPHLDHYNYETLQSLDSDRLVQDVKISTQGDAAVLIVEGNIIFAHPEIVEVCDLRYFMTLTREECWNIRKNRVYDPPDVPGFFEEYVWPCYLEHFVDVQKLTKQYSVEFLAGLQLDNNVQAINKAMRSRLLKNWVEIMNTKLSVDEAIEFVTLPECGAISTFIGTTRNSFDGKEVVHLEYEAYSPMALKELELLCGTLRSKWPSIAKIAILHRIGCPHRAEAIAAVESAIDNIKAHVPIWKLEVYKDSATWKANKECSWLHQDRPPISRE